MSSDGASKDKILLEEDPKWDFQQQKNQNQKNKDCETSDNDEIDDMPPNVDISFDLSILSHVSSDSVGNHHNDDNNVQSSRSISSSGGTSTESEYHLPLEVVEEDCFRMEIDTEIHSRDSHHSFDQLEKLFQENEQALHDLLLHENYERDNKNESDHQPPSDTYTSSNVEVSKKQLVSKWRTHLQFEFKYSIPGIGALLLYCLAHASTYELVSNVVYEIVESDTQIIPINKTVVYTTLLLTGCCIARCTGLIWDFVGPIQFRSVKFDLHNRLRLQMWDAKLLHILNDRIPFVVKGILDTLAFYLIYISMAHYISRLAVFCDQRSDILSKMPSRIFQQEALRYNESQQHTQQTWNSPLQQQRHPEQFHEHPQIVNIQHQQREIEKRKEDNFMYCSMIEMCPAYDSLKQSLGPMHLSSYNQYPITSFEADLLGCQWFHDMNVSDDGAISTSSVSYSKEDFKEDEYWAFGAKDDQYFYHTLSKNSYEKFFGLYWEQALFDTSHQILFYGSVALISIVVMQLGIGFRFWAGW